MTNGDRRQIMVIKKVIVFVVDVFKRLCSNPDPDTVRMGNFMDTATEANKMKFAVLLGSWDMFNEVLLYHTVLPEHLTIMEKVLNEIKEPKLEGWKSKIRKRLRGRREEYTISVILNDMTDLIKNPTLETN